VIESSTTPWRIADLTWPEVTATGFTIAVLPWGATEAHNTHLPYATDTLLAEAAADASAEVAWKAGARVAVLPSVAYGVQAGQLDIPFCINMSPTTQLALLRDIAVSLVPHGIRALLIVNAHGGNDFKPTIRELQASVPLFLGTLDWWKSGDAKAAFTEPGDHAGELETSVMQAVAPELVKPLASAGSGASRNWRFAAMQQGWAWAPRKWTSVSDDTGVGNPSRSTAEKGERYLAQCAENIGTFLAELDGALLNDDLYEA
jgi:creatinine amidohydrolase